MNRKLILVLVVIAGIAAMVAMSGKPEQKAPESAPAGSAQENPPAISPERELIVAIPAFGNTFNPYGSSGTPEIMYVINQTNDYLVRKDDKGEIVPSLAESFEIAPDGLSYTFHLRQGVKFSNGEEFKASDVKFSIDRGIKSPFTIDGFTEVKDCEVVDDYTAKINMKTANVSFLEKLTNWFAVMVSEKAYEEYGDEVGKTPETTIGTGPYILKEYKSGESAVFEANPDYFLGEAPIKKIRMKVISDTNAAVIALQTGEVDLYADDLPSIAFDSISKNEKLTIGTFPSQYYFLCFMNNQSGPFADVRLRQAVAYAADRQKMMLVGEEGRGVIVDNPGGPDCTANPGGETWYKQDIEKAKQLVKEAGMEGKTITIRTYSVAPYTKLATALQDDLNKIGLVAKVEQMERNAFIDDVLHKGEFEIGVARYWCITKDMDEVMYCLHTANIGSFNWSRYSNPKMDELVERAKGELDPEKRKEVYAEAVKLYTEEAPQVPLYYTLSNRAFTKDLTIGDGWLQYTKFYDFAWRQ